MLAMKTQGAVPKEIESVVKFRSQHFTLGQAKLKSVWADERIASIVSEMDSVERVRENVAAARSELSLTAEESHQLNQLAAFTAGYACNGCKHLCENAVAGPLAIAAPLRYLRCTTSATARPSVRGSCTGSFRPRRARSRSRSWKGTWRRPAACIPRASISRRGCGGRGRYSLRTLSEEFERTGH